VNGSPPADGNTDPADRFREAWADLLHAGHGGTLTAGIRSRLVNRTTALLARARTNEPFDSGPAAEAGSLLVHAHYTDPGLLAQVV
jgi:hypothetical protein